MADEIFSLDEIVDAWRKIREQERVVATSDPNVARVVECFPGCRATVVPGLPSGTIYIVSPDALEHMYEKQGQILIETGYERVVHEGILKLDITA